MLEPTAADITLCESFDIEGHSPSWYWIRNFAQTFDEHDLGVKSKPFPTDWEHFPIVCADLDAAMLKKGVSRIAYPKSRQIMVSWLLVAWMTYACWRFGNLHCAVKGKKEGESEYQLKRADHILRHLPVVLSQRSPVKRSIKALIEWENGSLLEAFPEGSEAIRSRVPTVLFLDEAAYQENFDESYLAALSNSRIIIMASSVFPGDFQRIVEDTDAEIDFGGVEPDFGMDRGGDTGRQEGESGVDTPPPDYRQHTGKDWRIVV